MDHQLDQHQVTSTPDFHRLLQQLQLRLPTPRKSAEFTGQLLKQILGIILLHSCTSKPFLPFKSYIQFNVYSMRRLNNQYGYIIHVHVSINFEEKTMNVLIFLVS